MVLRVQRAVGHFLGGLQNKGVAAGRGRFELAELCVVHLGVNAQLGQIGAHQRQMVFQINFADTQNPLHRLLVAQTAAERVAGIGGIGDYAAFAHDFRRLPDQSLLRIVGMDGKKLSHNECSLKNIGLDKPIYACCLPRRFNTLILNVSFIVKDSILTS